MRHSKQQNLTSEVLQDGSQVDGRPHPDAVLGQTPLDVAQHAAHREDDPGLGGPGRLGRLLLSSSARHGAESATSVTLCGWRHNQAEHVSLRVHVLMKP